LVHILGIKQVQCISGSSKKLLDAPQAKGNTSLNYHNKIKGVEQKNFNKSAHKRSKKDTHYTVTQRITMSCNPIKRAEKNESFPTYRANRFMIGRFNQALKDLRAELNIENMYKQRDIDKQEVEIAQLKGNCKHLEEAVEYIKSLNQSQQLETSTKHSKKHHPQQEESVNQFW